MTAKPQSFSELYNSATDARKVAKNEIINNNRLPLDGYRGVPFEGIYPAHYSDVTIGPLLTSENINGIISNLNKETKPLITVDSLPKSTKEEIGMNVENFDERHYYPTGYSGDSNISQLKKLKDVYDHYAVEKSDVIVGCAILCRATVSDDFNTDPAAYFSPYAKSHESLRHEVYSQASIRLEIPDDCFARKGDYIHGFYTKSGYFLDRVDAMVFMALYGHKIHEEQNVTSRYGLTSDNIWPKEVRPAIKAASAVPSKPIPKTVSQMMKEKKDVKLKKKLSRRF